MNVMMRIKKALMTVYTKGKSFATWLCLLPVSYGMQIYIFTGQAFWLCCIVTVLEMKIGYSKE